MNRRSRPWGGCYVRRKSTYRDHAEIGKCLIHSRVEGQTDGRPRESFSLDLRKGPGSCIFNKSPLPGGSEVQAQLRTPRLHRHSEPWPQGLQHHPTQQTCAKCYSLRRERFQTIMPLESSLGEVILSVFCPWCLELCLVHNDS